MKFVPAVIFGGTDELLIWIAVVRAFWRIRVPVFDMSKPEAKQSNVRKVIGNPDINLLPAA